MIILDQSTSIVVRSGGWPNWDTYVLGFVTSIIKAFTIGPTQTRIAIVSFSNTAWVSFSFDAFNNADDMINTVC